MCFPLTPAPGPLVDWARMFSDKPTGGITQQFQGKVAFCSKLFVLLALASFANAQLNAAAPDWTFHPQKVGQALVGGGWSVEYPLGEINASPEFSFPIQLVYVSTRESDGLFGSQWVSPQLESSLVPKGAGFLLWTTCSGGQVALRSQGDRQDSFVSFDGQWRANRTGARYEILQ